MLQEKGKLCINKGKKKQTKKKQYTASIVISLTSVTTSSVRAHHRQRMALLFN